MGDIPYQQTNPATNQTTVEEISDFGMSPEGWADYWRAEIRAADKETQKWRQRAERVVKRYRDEREDTGLGSYSKKYNIFWSNVQTMLPAIFGRAPEPIAQRRYLDPDNVARVASMILERCLDYQIRTQPNFVDGIRNALQDRLIPGLGTVWVRYQVSQQSPTGTVDNDYYSSTAGEMAPVDYVYWEDFGYIPARTWEEVPSVWRVVYMTRDQLRKRFGDEIGDSVKLDYTPSRHQDAVTSSQTDEPKHHVLKQARVYEIWDKRTSTVTWVHSSCPKPLDFKKDPMGFPGFFPCPKPLFATNTTGNLLPVPDFALYQDQANELDSLTQRLFYLTKALKVVGVYDSGQIGVQRMLTEGVENQLIPVDTWAAFAEKGGIKGTVDFMPIEVVAAVVTQLYEVRAKLIEDIYQITGISDIVRGAGNPNETATAQRIKAQFASVRLEDMKAQMGKFVTEILRLMAHVMTSFFKDETMLQQSAIMQTVDGQEAVKQAQEAQMQRMQQMMPQPAGPMPGPMGAMGAPPAPVIPAPNLQGDIIQQAIALLRNGRLADFRISVDTESMVEPDLAAERDARSQFLTSITQFMQAAVPGVEKTPELAPIVGGLLTWGIRGFRVGRDIEGLISSSLSELMAKAKGPKPPPPPDPKLLAIQAKSQADAQAGQQEFALKQQEMQAELAKMREEMGMERQRMMMELQNSREKTAAEVQAILIKAFVQASVKRQEMAQDAQVQAVNTQQELSHNEQMHQQAMQRKDDEDKTEKE